MTKEEKIVLLREMRSLLSEQAFHITGLCQAYYVACRRLKAPRRGMLSVIPELSIYQPNSLEWHPFWFDPLDVDTRLRIIDTVIRVIDNQF